jgi:alkylhydroperoxidase family enzyme
MLAYSDNFTVSDAVTDEVYERLGSVFSSEEIMKLTMTVGLSFIVNRVHAIFKTDIDDSTVKFVASHL